MSDRFPNGGPPSPWEPPRPPQKSGVPTWAKAVVIVGSTVLVILVAIPIVLVGLVWFVCSSH